MSTLLAGINLAMVTDLSMIWKYDCVDMLYFCDSIPWEVCLYWHLTLNCRVPIGSDDRTSMEWAFLLIKNLCTEYAGLLDCYKGAVTYLWIVFSVLFATSSDQIQSLKGFFTYFGSKGLQR